MTPEMVLDVGQEALWVTALLSAPLLISALVVGLLVGMVQAATQIQEMTLTFIPKLAVLGLALVVAGSWMLGLISDFAINLIERIPELIG
ncbi:MAG: flagellar biosynthesis protein FliQ [Gammaproteobacteria bacterium]|jgi:flagellar biosynthetic protein FliQ|nr:flagellar biosynthesis protein FliQ [Gammaproteobacteria bacterium]NNJ95836.1 flagellar biosynthesis protein FliQ [Gammaproteobacteria bacterium]